MHIECMLFLLFCIYPSSFFLQIKTSQYLTLVWHALCCYAHCVWESTVRDRRTFSCGMPAKETIPHNFDHAAMLYSTKHLLDTDSSNTIYTLSPWWDESQDPWGSSRLINKTSKKALNKSEILWIPSVWLVPQLSKSPWRRYGDKLHTFGSVQHIQLQTLAVGL